MKTTNQITFAIRVKVPHIVKNKSVGKCKLKSKLPNWLKLKVAKPE